VRNHDLVFLKHFSMVIAFLMGVTVVLIVFAHYMHGTAPHEPDLRAEARVAGRIAPVGAVYAGETGAAAMAAAAEAARLAAASQVAYEGTLDGSVIYTNLCGACHTAGVGGAPMLTQAAWSARTAQGVETLVKHAIEGFQGPAGLMPARGGNPSLTDAQVESTVKWMLDNLK
jgi:cytochrome c5